MTIKTKKKICAWISGGFAYTFIDMLWILPDIRVNEGLDWRIEIALYVVTLIPAIVFGWLASGD